MKTTNQTQSYIVGNLYKIKLVDTISKFIKTFKTKEDCIIAGPTFGYTYQEIPLMDTPVVLLSYFYFSMGFRECKMYHILYKSSLLYITTADHRDLRLIEVKKKKNKEGF